MTRLFLPEVRAVKTKIISTLKVLVLAGQVQCIFKKRNICRYG